MPIVSILDTDKTYNVNEGEILYDALSDQGLNLPHGCLSGSCGACKIQIISSEGKLSEAGVIEQNTITAIREDNKNYLNIDLRLSCRLKVTTSICIKPLK